MGFSNKQNGNVDIIKNEKYKVEIYINRVGAELIGWKIGEKKYGVLYRDGEIAPPPKGWKNHATILFPVVGRLKNNISKYDSKIITFKKNHGFARDYLFSPISIILKKKSASITYLMKSDDNLKKYYPFDFNFYVTYIIKKDKLKVKFIVENLSQEVLYFSLGWHPGFVIYNESSYLQFKGKNLIYYKVSENNLLTGEKEVIDKVKFNQLLLGDIKKALIFEIKEKKYRKLLFYNGLFKIFIKFKDFPFLGIWSEDKKRFICIEPWHGTDDFENQTPFDEKLGIISLKKRKKKTFSIELRIKF